MKKILISGLVVLTVFIIYLSNMDRKVYYLALGNSSKYIKGIKGYSYYVSDYLREKGVLEKYLWEYSDDNKRITDLINDIESNKKYMGNTMKNALIKADLVTLSIDASDVFEKLEESGIIYNDIYNYIDDLTLDLERLFKLMREYCKEDIVFIGYYNLNNSEVVSYLNKRYQEAALEYDIKFVDVSNSRAACLNSKSVCYRNISNNVIRVIDKSVFEG